MNTKLKLLSIVSTIACLLLPIKLIAATENSVLISEISMGSANSATEEFVELYNNSDSPVSLTNWSIYYKSATGKTWSKRASLTANSSIAGHTFFLTSTNSVGQDANLISGMSQTSGVVELRDDKGNVVDRVGWGSTDTSNGKAAVTPEAGQSLYRQYESGTNLVIDTGDNFSDFYIATTPTPKTVPVVEIEQIDEDISYPVMMITELYPNPTDDESESTDEFIEIYNPNKFEVDLSGWLLKDASGNVFIIKNYTIAPESYAVFMSSETHLSLNNTGDTISLVNPTGDTVEQSSDYGESKEGLSWGLINGAWDWNTVPTPGLNNSSVYIAPIVIKPTATKSSAKTAAKKKAVAKKALAQKPKANKLKASKEKTANDITTENQSSLNSKFANLWPWLLIILGTGTIGYGIYEYRPEITSAYFRLKNKFGPGR